MSSWRGGAPASQELGFSLLSVTAAAQGEFLISQAADRLGVSPGAGEIKRFQISGLLSEDWCPGTLAQPCVVGPVSWYLVQPNAAMDPSAILGSSCPLSEYLQL